MAIGMVHVPAKGPQLPQLGPVGPSHCLGEFKAHHLEVQQAQHEGKEK